MKDKDRLSAAVRSHIGTLCASSGTFTAFLEHLVGCGETAVVGGAPRDWFLDRTPRDLDLVVDTTPERLHQAVAATAKRRTRYGGYAVDVGNQSIDVWCLSSTWAFTVRPSLPNTFDNLPKTAFYNVDAVAVSLSTGTVFECGFADAVNTKTLSIVFEDNPYPHLCAVRGLWLAKYYQLRLDRRVTEFFEFLTTTGSTWRELNAAQVDHYGEVRVRPADVVELLPSSIAKPLLRSLASG